MFAFNTGIFKKSTNTAPYLNVKKNADGTTSIECPKKYGFGDNQELHAKNGIVITDALLKKVGAALKAMDDSRDDAARQGSAKYFDIDSRERLAKACKRHDDATNAYFNLTEKYGVKVLQRCPVMQRSYK